MNLRLSRIAGFRHRVRPQSSGRGARVRSQLPNTNQSVGARVRVPQASETCDQPNATGFHDDPLAATRRRVHASVPSAALLIPFFLIASTNTVSGQEVRSEAHSATALTVVDDDAIDYRAIAAIASTRVLPTSPLESLGADRVVRIRAARGEYESASFAIRNLSSARQIVSVSPLDLTGDGVLIPSSSIDIKYVLTWYQAPGAWTHWRRRDKSWRAELVPELIAHDPNLIVRDDEAEHNYIRLRRGESDSLQLISERALSDENRYRRSDDFPVRDASELLPVTLDPNTTQQYWITVHVPADATPGRYGGEIRLSAGGGFLARIPVELTVLDFELPPPILEYSIYYRGKLAPHHPTVSHEWKDETQLAADYAAMASHGITNPSCYQRLRAKLPVEKASPASSVQLLERHLEIRREAGFGQRPLYYLGRLIGRAKGEKARRTLEKDVQRLRAIADRHGVTAIYLYGVDEAKGGEVRAQRSMWSFARSLGVRVFAAGRDDHVTHSGALTDLLVYRGDRDPDLERETIRIQRAAGNRTFMYANPQTGPEDPLLWRRNYGFELWRRGYDGAMPFAYQSQFGDIWNDWDNRIYRTEAFAYPAVDGPILTIAFEGFREAVDDVRYLSRLIAEINALSSADDTHPGQEEALRAARAFLVAIESQPVVDPEIVRDRIILHLDRIRAANASRTEPAPTQRDGSEIAPPEPT